MRTAVYTRISNDETGEGAGVQRQLDACLELADRLGWQVAATYDDNDVSAFTGKTRPGFEALLDAMKRGEVDALVCWHADRLYRSMGDLERVIEIADAARVQIRTVNGGDLDLSNSSGRMLARILGSVARQESEHKGERQRAANAQRAAAGAWQTANRPFGYTLRGEPLEPEATHVRQAVADVLAGKSVQSIARAWTAAGIKTTLGKTQWNSPRVRRILLNPRNAGIRVHRGREVGRGNWTPIVSEADHRAIVAKLTDPSRITNRGSFERKRIGSGIYLCGRCGATMKAHQAVRANGTVAAYTCREHAHLVRASKPVDDYVSEVILRRLESEVVVIDREIDLAALQNERDGLRGRLDILTDAFADGTVDAEQFRRGSASLRAKLGAVDGKIADATARNPVADLLSNRDRLRQRWAAMTPTQQSEVVSRLVTVTILPCPRGPGGFDSKFVEIVWRTEDSAQGRQLVLAQRRGGCH